MLFRQRLLLNFLCSLLISSVFGQNFIIDDQVPPELLVNGGAGTFNITIENNSASNLSASTIEVDLPTGITYTIGSLDEKSTLGLNVVSTSPLTLFLSSFPADSIVNFDIELKAICNAIDFQKSGGGISK